MKTKIKAIIMDKAPKANGLTVAGDLGFTPGDLAILATAINAEYGSNIQGTDLETLPTFEDLFTYIDTHTP